MKKAIRLALGMFAMIFALICNAQAFNKPIQRQTPIAHCERFEDLFNAQTVVDYSLPAVEPRARTVIYGDSFEARFSGPTVDRQPSTVTYTSRDYALLGRRLPPKPQRWDGPQPFTVLRR